MNKTIILLSIDGLGLGAMEESQNFNTWKTIIDNTNSSELKFLKKIIDNSQKLALDYPGADSYLGHLTMSGINIDDISLNPLSQYFHKIVDVLKKNHYNIENKNGILVVDNKFIIYDNFEADHGLAINILASFDKISFEEIKNIAEKIRKIINNPRLIAFGAHHIKINEVIQKNISQGKYYGIKTPNTGVYNDTFKVKHFPHLSNFNNSIQEYALANNWQVFFYGKFGDIINIKNSKVIFFPNINISKIFDEILEKKDINQAIHFVNIQQTDLAGHEGNIKKYIEILEEIEVNLKKILKEDFRIILTSDHGNDPAIDDGKHTREFVPLWTCNIDNNDISTTKLSDIAHLVKKLLI